MKHTIIILVTALLFSMPSFAHKVVNDPVLASFNKEFHSAENVQWSRVDNYYKVSFRLDDQFVTAFYEESGHLLALTRNISTAQLPLALRLSLKKNLDEFWVTELFELSSDEGTYYYLTLENGSESILLRSVGHSDWSRVKKTIK